MREGELQHPGGDVLRAPPWRAPPGGFSCLAQGMGLCRRDLGFRFGDLRFGIWDWGIWDVGFVVHPPAHLDGVVGGTVTNPCLHLLVLGMF